MFSTLRWLVGGAGPTGYAFVATDEGGPLTAAKPGMIVRNPDDAPPWMVVADAPGGVIPTRWPGRLIRVRVLRAVPDQPFPGSGYTRASAVQVEAVVSPGMIFGERGDALLEILEVAAALEPEGAAALAAARHPGAREAFSRCWKRWLGATGERRLAARDHGETLVASERRSPVGPGFTLLESLVVRRARVSEGGRPFARDGEDEWLIGDWGEAAAALREGMMALGAPAGDVGEDGPVLLQGWRETFGAGR